MTALFDTYNRRARLEPALLVALPIALATLAWFPGDLLGWGALSSVIVWSGVATLLTQLARDRGKRREAALFESWGGKPTTRMLRHRDSTNKVLLERRHEKLKEIMPTIALPTADDEANDEAKADDVYETFIVLLLERTRDKKQFPLVFEENCNYGFRRNTWGLKPLGIGASALSIIAIAFLFIFDYRHGIEMAHIAWICFIGSLLVLLTWIFVITANWVRVPAEEFAARLLASAENLAAG